MMRFNKIKPEFKNLYFDAWKKDALNLFADKELFMDFFDNLYYGNKKIFQQLLISDTGEEFQILRKTYNLYQTNKHLSREITDLEKEIHALKKSNDKKLDSMSWKMSNNFFK